MLVVIILDDGKGSQISQVGRNLVFRLGLVCRPAVLVVSPGGSEAHWLFIILKFGKSKERTLVV